ncbi:MAG: hypothetical protein M1826_003994 [Phylliscum demangeonii]|nr:MAG: hypothetical protein M1826_003994 [Phylliscum demangeonii]
MHRRQTEEPVAGVDDTTLMITARQLDARQQLLIHDTVRDVTLTHGAPSIRVELIIATPHMLTFPIERVDDTTVLITAQHEDPERWRNLEETVRQLCRKHGQATLRVELVNGLVERWGANGYNQQALMGASLSMAGADQSSGALGGYLTVHRCALDWALIRVKEGRWGTNHFPERSGPDTPVTSISRMEEDDELVMVSRAYGVRRGRYSHIESNVSLPGQPQESDEIVVVGATRQPFGFPGDSGAWVLDKQRALVGMVMGGAEDGSYTYVTPMHEIFSDIQDQTGFEARLPIVDKVPLTRDEKGDGLNSDDYERAKGSVDVSYLIWVASCSVFLIQ